MTEDKLDEKMHQAVSAQHINDKNADLDNFGEYGEAVQGSLTVKNSKDSKKI